MAEWCFLYIVVTGGGGIVVFVIHCRNRGRVMELYFEIYYSIRGNVTPWCLLMY